MIALFCRGHGFGHAARSLRVLTALRRRGHDVTVVSYGYGAQYFRLMGVECIDAGIVDRRDFAPEAVSALAAVVPGLAHAELFVVDELHYLPNLLREHSAAPIVMLTDWLFAERDLGVDTMLYPARRTLVVDFAEAHPLDDFTAARVEFVGPVAPAQGDPVPRDRAQGRSPRSPGGRRIVVALGGSAANPASLRLLQTMVPLLLRWADREDRILVLGDDPAPGALTDDRVQWLGLRADASALFADADLAVCNGTGMTTCELAHLGVPTIAFLAPVYADVHDPVSVRRVQLLARHAPLEAVGPEVTDEEFDRSAARVLSGDRTERLLALRASYISPDALVDLILEDRDPRASLDRHQERG